MPRNKEKYPNAFYKVMALVEMDILASDEEKAKDNFDRLIPGEVKYVVSVTETDY